jgi:TPR repeat protein
MYRDGRGVAKDEAKALDLFRQGAMWGNRPSQAELGRRYEEGAGVPRDLVESLAWRFLAALDESPQAVGVRDAMLRSLPAAQIERARLRAQAINAEIAEINASRRRP